MGSRQNKAQHENRLLSERLSMPPHSPSPSPTQFAGVDGCRSGWLLAIAADLQTMPDFQVLATFSEVMEATRSCLRVAVDMPIGLPLRGQVRDCDRKARQLLGRRACTIFSAPPRESLDIPDYATLRAWGMSCQTFNLIPKIREIDVLQPDPGRYFEAHPELIFAHRNAGRPLEPKRSKEGQRLRESLLPWTPSSRPPRGASYHDLLDACALLLCAVQGPRRVPSRLEYDDRGRLMSISF